MLFANDHCSHAGPVWRPRRCFLLPHLSDMSPDAARELSYSYIEETGCIRGASPRCTEDAKITILPFLPQTRTRLRRASGG